MGGIFFILYHQGASGVVTIAPIWLLDLVVKIRQNGNSDVKLGMLRNIDSRIVQYINQDAIIIHNCPIRTNIVQVIND